LETAVGICQHTPPEPAIIAVLTALQVVTSPKGTMPEKQMQKLKNEREPLFRRLANYPNEIHLALEIKLIDDQIAECNRLIQKERKTRTLLTR
jgi:hypothetical protein